MFGQSVFKNIMMENDLKEHKRLDFYIITYN